MQTKKLCNVAVAVICAVSAVGSNFDPMSRALLSLGDRQPLVSAMSRDSEPVELYQPMIIAYSDPELPDKLRQLGVIIYNGRADMLLCTAPLDVLGTIDEMPGVVAASLSTVRNSVMLNSRQYSHVDQVQQGWQLPQAYDGSGVVVGISDIGFDPHHGAFEGYVSELHHYDDLFGRASHATDAAQLAEWTTDNNAETHATHVANILAGHPAGTPYWGVAPGAQLVVTTSRLYDPGILAGVEDIIASAKAAGRPAVINLSLSSHLGPHDGTSLPCRYLEACSADAAICISAGNDGDTKLSVVHRMQAGEEFVGTSLQSSIDWLGKHLDGFTDVWSSDDRPVEMAFVIFDKLTEQLVYRSPWIGNDGDLPDNWSADSRTDAAFGNCFSGSVSMAAGYGAFNGRSNITLAYNYRYEGELFGSYQESRYYGGVEVRAPEGSQVYIVADGSHSFLTRSIGLPGYIAGSSDFSINDLATTPSVTAVGMYAANGNQTDFSGREYTAVPGEVCRYSSFGTTVDGRVFPHVCAPGDWLVSAASGPYVAAEPGRVGHMSHQSQFNGQTDYWYIERGTSMSSPHVAGVYALWLQANPHLSATELRDIAMQTSRTDLVDMDNPRWGAGAIDAWAGLQRVLSSAGITAPAEGALVRVVGNDIVIDYMPAGADVSLHDISGKPVSHLTGLAPGIYILTINSQPHKILISY